MQAAICAMVVWFGLFEPGSIALHKGEAVREREVVQASAGESASAIYDTKPLPIVTASYKSNEPVEGKEPAKPAIPLRMIKQHQRRSRPIRKYYI